MKRKTIIGGLLLCSGFIGLIILIGILQGWATALLFLFVMAIVAAIISGLLLIGED